MLKAINPPPHPAKKPAFIDYDILMAENWENWNKKWSANTVVVTPSSFDIHYMEYTGKINMKKCLNVKTLPVLRVQDFYEIKKNDMKLSEKKLVCHN